MTNAGANGFPSRGAVPDGSITAAKLASPFAWGNLKVGNYYWTASPSGSGTSSTLGNGTLRVAPWVVPNPCRLSRIGASVTSAGDANSLVRLGIYSDDGTGYPGALLLDAGTIAGDSATVQEITINQAVTPGLYWIGAAVQAAAGTQPTVTTATQAPHVLNLAVSTSTPTTGTTVLGFFQTSVSAALPGVFSQTVNASGAIPRVFVKVA